MYFYNQVNIDLLKVEENNIASDYFKGVLLVSFANPKVPICYLLMPMYL